MNPQTHSDEALIERGRAFRSKCRPVTIALAILFTCVTAWTGLALIVDAVSVVETPTVESMEVPDVLWSALPKVTLDQIYLGRGGPIRGGFNSGWLGLWVGFAGFLVGGFITLSRDNGWPILFGILAGVFVSVAGLLNAQRLADQIDYREVSTMVHAANASGEHSLAVAYVDAQGAYLQAVRDDTVSELRKDLEFRWNVQQLVDASRSASVHFGRGPARLALEIAAFGHPESQWAETAQTEMQAKVSADAALAKWLDQYVELRIAILVCCAALALALMRRTRRIALLMRDLETPKAATSMSPAMMQAKLTAAVSTALIS